MKKKAKRGGGGQGVQGLGEDLKMKILNSFNIAARLHD